MKKTWLSGPYILWMIVFILLPLFMIVYYAFTNQQGAFTVENVTAIFDSVHMKALILSLKLALITTILCLLISYPLAIILSKWKIRRKGMLVFLFVLPMWMNFMLRLLALQLLISDNGIINAVLGFLGLPQMEIMNTQTAVILGMVYDYLPFMILPLYNAISKIGDDVINAARDLGANGSCVIRKIIIPLSMPGAISGIVMVFIPAMTTFVISDLLGGAKTQLIGNIINQEFMLSYNWQLGSGLSFVLMLFVIISMAFAQSRGSKEGLV